MQKVTTGMGCVLFSGIYHENEDRMAAIKICLAISMNFNIILGFGALRRLVH
jgi:hypothetical protein